MSTAGDLLRISRQFYDEHWSWNRAVTSLDWSPQFRELVLASFDDNEQAPQQPEGVVLIWNLNHKNSTSPEYILHYESSVTAGCFSPVEPYLVIGGTHSGQVVVWDVRSGCRTPVQRTLVSAAADSAPVLGVQVIHTDSTHSLATMSADNRMRFWSLDKLTSPLDCVQLHDHRSTSDSVEPEPTCFSFVAGGSSGTFVVGNDAGVACVGARQRDASARAYEAAFRAHRECITGVDCHDVAGPIDLSCYFLTSSTDWTVKLWNVTDSRPLLSLVDNMTYICDVRWSPAHPAVFAAGDFAGFLNVWNLNSSVKVPAATTVVADEAIVKCRWNVGGTLIAAGDTDGGLYVCEVDSSLTQPRDDDWPQLVFTIADAGDPTDGQDAASCS